MTETVLTVDGLSKTYSTSEGTVEAVDDVSFSVDRGEIVGLMGPNGAGKTTTIKCTLGLITPSAGSSEILGIETASNPKPAYEHTAAVLEGARNLYWRLTVRENLRFFAGSQGIHPDDIEERYDRVLTAVGLQEKADEEVRTLSRGMKQKASLACAMIQDPDILFLDEPTLGLDVESAVALRREIRRLATDEDTTILLSSHDMDVVQDLCERVIIFQDGEIAADDRVDNLIEVFETQTYEVSFGTGTEPDDQDLAVFAHEWIDTRGLPTVEVTLDGSDDLYRFMEICRNVDAEVERIESVEPDLESAFLRVIDHAEPARSEIVAGEHA